MCIQQIVHALKDPRTFAFNQPAYFIRGWLEYLVAYENDGTFTPRFLKSWEISEDSKTYTLNVRKCVVWNNGDPFTADDVARNVEQWCDKSLEGNSMTARFASMVDQQTGKVIEGGIEVIHDHTVPLNLPKPDITLIPGMAD